MDRRQRARGDDLFARLVHHADRDTTRSSSTVALRGRLGSLFALCPGSASPFPVFQRHGFGVLRRSNAGRTQAAVRVWYPSGKTSVGARLCCLVAGDDSSLLSVARSVFSYSALGTCMGPWKLNISGRPVRLYHFFFKTWWQKFTYVLVFAPPLHLRVLAAIGSCFHVRVASPPPSLRVPHV